MTWRQGDRVACPFPAPRGQEVLHLGTVLASDRALRTDRPSNPSLTFSVRWDCGAVGTFTIGCEPAGFRRAVDADAAGPAGALAELRRVLRQYPTWPDAVRRALTDRAHELAGARRWT